MEKSDYILERTLSNGSERQLMLPGPGAYSEVESGLPGVKVVGEGIRCGSRTALPSVRFGCNAHSTQLQLAFNALLNFALPLLGDVIIDCKTSEARQEISLLLGGPYLY
jgi:hypothetical protein